MFAGNRLSAPSKLRRRSAQPDLKKKENKTKPTNNEVETETGGGGVGVLSLQIQLSISITDRIAIDSEFAL